MPANALIAFESAARHGNFTLAGRELRTSQAAMSRQIGKLETWLSVRLFERSPGVRLVAASRRGNPSERRRAVSAGALARSRRVRRSSRLPTHHLCPFDQVARVA